MELWGMTEGKARRDDWLQRSLNVLAINEVESHGLHQSLLVFERRHPLLSVRHIHETAVVALERHRNHASWSVAVLGNDEIRFTGSG